MEGNRIPQWWTERLSLCHYKAQHIRSTPAIKLGRIRHTKLMVLHASIASKNGASKIIVNSPDDNTVFVN